MNRLLRGFNFLLSSKLTTAGTMLNAILVVVLTPLSNQARSPYLAYSGVRESAEPVCRRAYMLATDALANIIVAALVFYTLLLQFQPPEIAMVFQMVFVTALIVAFSLFALNFQNDVDVLACERLAGQVAMSLRVPFSVGFNSIKLTVPTPPPQA